MRFVHLAAVLLLFAVTAGVWSAELPAPMRAVIEKSQSFGVDGYPIGFWMGTELSSHMSHMNEAAVQDWADVGFTVAMSPDFNYKIPKHVAHISKMLDWCEKRDIKMIVCDSRAYARSGGEAGLLPPGYEDSFKAAVKDFGSHPAAFGFHVGDEPNPAFLPSFCESMRVQKRIAPNLHPFGNLLPIMWILNNKDMYPVGKSPEDYLDEYVRKSNCDILAWDCYTQMNTPERGTNKQHGENGIANYYENLRVFRDASLRNGIPFWNTLLSVGHFAYRCPTLDDFRWQVNTSVCYGAHGLLWYFYYMRAPGINYRQAPIDEFWQPTQTHYNLALVQKSFHKTYGDLFTHLVSTKVMFAGKVYGSGRAFEPDSMIAKVKTDITGHPILIGEFADIEGRRYLMIVNNSQTVDSLATITIPGEDAQVYGRNWDGKEPAGWCPALLSSSRDSNGLVLSHYLAPGQEAFYRVESSQLAKEPIKAE